MLDSMRLGLTIGAGETWLSDPSVEFNERYRVRRVSQIAFVLDVSTLSVLLRYSTLLRRFQFNQRQIPV